MIKERVLSSDSGISLKEFSVRNETINRVVSEIRGRANVEDSTTKTVGEIISQVRTGKDLALFELSRKYDKTTFSKPSEFFVDEEEFKTAEKSLGREKILALKSAYTQIRFLARNQMIFRYKEKKYRTPLGFLVSERFVPLSRIGGYVPGGLASYPSTVLMICGPAREAGVKDIVLATPPNKDGKINEAVLVAAKICGVKEVIKLGGAQAIAALAYGTESIRKVDLIAGPGNQYVTEAKKQVSATGQVSIDVLAGPTELLIIADGRANPEYVFEDLVSQAEHGNRTLCGIVSDSRELLSKVRSLFNSMSDRKRLKQIRESYLFLVSASTLNEATNFIQSFAPEHLEIMVSGKNILRSFTTSGLVLLGDYSPCSATDYIVGTDHILPTGGSASRFSGVSVESFMKRVVTVNSSKNSLKKSLKALSTLAQMEGLPNHARAAEFRFVMSKKKRRS